MVHHRRRKTAGPPDRTRRARPLPDPGRSWAPWRAPVRTVAESGPQLPVQLAVLLRVGGPHLVTHQPGAALGERVELAGTLDPAVPELCRRPELQCIAHLRWIPEATSDQQRLDRRTAGSHHVAQPEGGPSELVDAYTRMYESPIRVEMSCACCASRRASSIRPWVRASTAPATRPKQTASGSPSASSRRDASVTASCHRPSSDPVPRAIACSSWAKAMMRRSSSCTATERASSRPASIGLKSPSRKASMAEIVQATVRSFRGTLGSPATCSIQPRPSRPVPPMYQ
jgi:hypothetical protein